MQTFTSLCMTVSCTLTYHKRRQQVIGKMMSMIDRFSESFMGIVYWNLALTGG